MWLLFTQFYAVYVYVLGPNLPGIESIIWNAQMPYYLLSKSAAAPT